MKNKGEKDLDNRRYEGAILTFAVVQVIIGMFQLVLASIDSERLLTRWVGASASMLLAFIMFYLFREIKKLK